MKVLVDTSVWSLAFRKKGPEKHPAVPKLAALIEENQGICLTGLILQEILQAFKNEKSAKKMERDLEPVPLLQLSRKDYVDAARLRRKCASKGIAVTTADCQIAQAAVANGCPLLTADKDFERISRVSNLKLL